MNRGTGLGPLLRSELGRGGRGGGHGGGGSRWVVGLRSLRRPPPCLSRTCINLCDVCQICTLSGLHGHRPCRRHRSGLICGGGGGDGSGDVSAGLIGGDHNAKGTFALSAAPRRTNGREHARGRARARARACGVSACRPRACSFSVSPTRVTAARPLDPNPPAFRPRAYPHLPAHVTSGTIYMGRTDRQTDTQTGLPLGGGVMSTHVTRTHPRFLAYGSQ